MNGAQVYESMPEEQNMETSTDLLVDIVEQLDPEDFTFEQIGETFRKGIHGGRPIYKQEDLNLLITQDLVEPVDEDFSVWEVDGSIKPTSSLRITLSGMATYTSLTSRDFRPLDLGGEGND